ncbi:MAG: tetratricopeptide repeat protein, partial [Verrucomicrobiae bacterium]|nr:tetratricopeptide repeat protein [Verrucomicrobiae bacterium]
MASSPKEQSTPDKKQETYSKLDEAYAESNLEDQVLVYWNRHKNQIVLAVAAALLIIVGFQLTKWWKSKTIADRAEAYAVATDDSQKQAFADKHSGTDLGGVAFLELADKAYEEADYTKAAGFYQKALDAFKMVEFKQRAHLGLAMSNLQAVNESAAINELETIASNKSYPEASRGEALYQLSIID